MADLGVDFSFARITGTDIKAQGYNFVCRYLASAAAKRITIAEVTDFRNNRLGIVLVWEDEANAALGGFVRGQADASEALNQSGAIGFPANIPLYFAVDFDASEAQQVAINAYFDGIISVLGLARTGGYGGYWVIKRLFDAGKITFGWQAIAWSGGQVDPRIHIYQNGGSAFNGNADIDEAREANFGQWPTGEIMVDDAGARLILTASTLLAVDGPGPDRQPTKAEVENLIGRTYNDALQQVLNYTPWGNNWNKVKHYDGDIAVLKSQLAAGNIKPDITPPAKPLPNLTNNIPHAKTTTPVNLPTQPAPTLLQKLWKVLFG